MARMLIADEHPLFRDAIRGVVDQVFGGTTNVDCREAHSIDALMGLADGADDLDGVLLDLALLREQGFTELVTLCSRSPSVPVIVFSALEDNLVAAVSHDKARLHCQVRDSTNKSFLVLFQKSTACFLPQ